MRLAITCNGPGETAGWLTPLLRALYEEAPGTQTFVFYVPDDYASGFEPGYVREQFPNAHVFDPKTYVRVALGARVADVPERVDAVVYLGGDLMHAGRLHKRFGGALATYKFTNRKLAKRTARAFAVDTPNAAGFIRQGVSPDRVTVCGNLAIDGALRQARLNAGDADLDVLFMPGSRGYEVEHLVPFFFTAALRMLAERPQLRVAFGISPFTSIDAVRYAVERGGDPRVFAQRGELVRENGTLSLTNGSIRVPLVREAIAAASRARLAVTIPGTKVIELAAIGTPVISCTAMNAPELVTINGPLTYLNRIPLAGVPLKRTIVQQYARRFRFHTQPNIDAQQDLVLELRGTLTPGRVARVALERLDDTAWQERTSQALRNLYREHVGASARMAAGLLSLRPAV